MSNYQILYDKDVNKLMTVEESISKMEECLLAKSGGKMKTPPRFSLDANRGSLIFTAGAYETKENVMGFRAHDVFDRKKKEDEGGHEELTAVFDASSGVFKGIIIGESLGHLHAAAINGIAIKHLANEDVEVLSIIGIGEAAEVHIEAALLARDFTTIKIYHPSKKELKDFVSKMSKKYKDTDLDIEGGKEAKEVVKEADVLVCTTRSKEPLFNAYTLKRGAHVSSMGPNLYNANEISPATASISKLVVTDSLEQVQHYGNRYFLDTKAISQMQSLEKLIANPKKNGRKEERDITLFCFSGLAGTDVVLANEIMNRKLIKKKKK